MSSPVEVHRPRNEAALQVAKILHRIETTLMVSAFLMMLVTAVIQIAARNLTGTGIFWGDALVRTLVLWIALLGGMAASRNGRHIHIDLADHFVRGVARSLWKRMTHAITAAICGALAYASWNFVAGEFVADTRAIGPVPVWIFASMLPIGFAVMATRHGLSFLFPALVARHEVATT